MFSYSIFLLWICVKHFLQESNFLEKTAFHFHKYLYVCKIYFCSSQATQIQEWFMYRYLYTKCRASSVKYKLIHILEIYFYWSIIIWYMSTQYHKLLYKSYIVWCSICQAFPRGRLLHLFPGKYTAIFIIYKTQILLSWKMQPRTEQYELPPLAAIMESTKLLPHYMFKLLQPFLRSDRSQVTCYIYGNTQIKTIVKNLMLYDVGWCDSTLKHIPRNMHKVHVLSLFEIVWCRGNHITVPLASKVIQENKSKEIIWIHCEIYYHKNKSSNSLCMFYGKCYIVNLRPSVLTPQVSMTNTGCACENVGMMTILNSVYSFWHSI